MKPNQIKERNPTVQEKKLKNKVIKSEEFILKESRR